MQILGILNWLPYIELVADDIFTDESNQIKQFSVVNRDQPLEVVGADLLSHNWQSVIVSAYYNGIDIEWAHVDISAFAMEFREAIRLISLDRDDGLFDNTEIITDD